MYVLWYSILVKHPGLHSLLTTENHWSVFHVVKPEGIEKLNLQVREIEVLVAEIFHLILTLCSSYDDQQSDCRNEQSD